MGRPPCCDENGLKKGPWTPEEDQKLIQYIDKHGHGSWRALPKLAGLNRCGKSCRLRWTNYLRPDIKRGKFSPEEEQAILNLHSILGNKWSAIATHLPGRTDNEIKNFWNTHLKKKLIQMGFDPMTHRPRTDIFSSLPQLLALANLRELMDRQLWDDHPLRLQQVEALQLARLQCLQYLLQSTTTMDPNNAGSSIIGSTPLEQLLPITPLVPAAAPDGCVQTAQFPDFPQQELHMVPPNEANHVSSRAVVMDQGGGEHAQQIPLVSPDSSVLPLNDVSTGKTTNGDASSSTSYDPCGTPNSLWNELLSDFPEFA